MSDHRRLGLSLAALTIDDGLPGVRAIALDGPHLKEGFYSANSGVRWT
jgi:hypothetical protein